MRIERLRAYRVRLPLVHQFQTSSHRKGTLEHILIEATGADGSTGWGEIASPSDPYYCPETVDTAALVLERYLAPMVLGREWEHPRDVAALLTRVRGHRFAKAGIDIAAWDLWSRARGVGVADALGGTRGHIQAGVSLGIEPTLDALVAEVAKHVSQGYRRVKLKIMPGWDVEPVRVVRQAFPDLAVQVDANGIYRESPEHLAVLRELDGAGLLMIEQPFAPGALAAHARLQRRFETPVCLDESVDDVDQLDSAIALAACRVLNIKVSRMGGLTEAVRAHGIATENGIGVWCGGMHEFGIGRAANVALASLPGFAFPSDVSGSDKYYTRDITTRPIVATGGMVEVPRDRPGLGYEVDRPWLDELAGPLLDLPA